MIQAQRHAEEERASVHMLSAIQKAFKEALLALPVEEYDWFNIHVRDGKKTTPRRHAEPETPDLAAGTEDGTPVTENSQKQFYEFAGPLFSVRVSPASCVVPVGQSRTLRAVARDRARHPVERHLRFQWEILEGAGRLENADGEIIVFHAPAEPGLTRLKVTVTQDAVVCLDESAITVTDSLLPEAREASEIKHGLPGYTFKRAPGELWRSRYDPEQNVIVINNAHRDFVYASRNKSLKLRYIARLFAKEMVHKNFPGHSGEQLLERMIELSLSTEENLRL